jgi:5-(carboxyamino)imidazole ribonucleotide synthase
VHRNGILHTSTVPAPDVSDDLADQIRSATKIIAHRLNYVGVLCIEFFVLEDGSVVANEMAPRPHNSGHFTMDACLANQFEQQIRAMTGLPLATYHQHSPVVMVNLLGDEWLVPARSADGQPVEPDWENVLAHPWAKLHLYGKSEPRKGRKMGHVNCVAPTLAEAQSAASQVMRVLHLSR